MKLAEALSIRKDLQKRVEQTKTRIINCVKVQEGDEPAEDPKELMAELERCLQQLQGYIERINATNSLTQSNGKTLTQLMAERDVQRMRLQSLREVFDRASSGQDRYSRSEIKFVTTIDVKKLSSEIDKRSKELRELDITIQALNFSTELV